MAQSDACSFVENDHEIFPTEVFTFSLLQEEQLSVSGEQMCVNTGYPLRRLKTSG